VHPGIVFGEEVLMAQLARVPRRYEPPEEWGRFSGFMVEKVGFPFRRRRNVIFSMKKAAVVGQARSFTYGHFFTEFVLHLVRLYESLPKEVPILYYSHRNKHVSDAVFSAFVELGLWDPARFVVVDFKENPGSIFVEELYVAPPFKSAEGMRQLRDFLSANRLLRLHPLRAAQNFSRNALQVIFQIRRKRNRRWDNHDLCQSTIESLASSRSLLVNISRDLGSIPVNDAIAFYETMDVVVGPHGAGMSNAVFLRPGAAIVEICHEGPYYCRWFADDLRAMGHRVFSLNCQECTHHDPIRVDHVELSELVLHLAATKKSELADEKNAAKKKTVAQHGSHAPNHTRP